MQAGSKRWRQIGTAYLFLLPTIVILGTFQFWPMLQAFALAFKDFSLLTATDEWVGLDNFRRLWGDPAFWLALGNSFLYLMVVPVVITLAMLLAVLVEPQLPFMGIFRAAFYVPVVTMMLVVALAWRMILDTDFGLLNLALKQAGIIRESIPWLTSERMALWTIMSVTIWKGLGYYMVLFIVGLKAVPAAHIEAARIDGARPWQVFLHVKLPALWPIITLTSILSAISALQVFEEIYVMTRGQLKTSTIVYKIYETGFDPLNGSGEMGYACAMGLVLFVVLLVFSAVAMYLMEKVYTT